MGIREKIKHGSNRSFKTGVHTFGLMGLSREQIAFFFQFTNVLLVSFDNYYVLSLKKAIHKAPNF